MKRSAEWQSEDEWSECLEPHDTERVYLVNVGFKGGLSGSAIVDMILNGVKEYKYFSAAVSCAGHWLFLRQIHCEERGLVRCAIKLHPAPTVRSEAFRTEWGWRQETSAPKATAYKILAVRTLCPPFKCTFTHQGLPFVLPACDERAAILRALDDGENVVERDQELLLRKASPRQAQRAEARERRAAKRREISVFPNRSEHAG